MAQRWLNVGSTMAQRWHDRGDSADMGHGTTMSHGDSEGMGRGDGTIVVQRWHDDGTTMASGVISTFLKGFLTFGNLAFWAFGNFRHFGNFGIWVFWQF